MNAFPVPGRNFGKNTPYGEQAAELAEQYFACAAQARAGLAAGHLDTLVALARLMAQAFARRKREAGAFGQQRPAGVHGTGVSAISLLLRRRMRTASSW